ILDMDHFLLPLRLLTRPHSRQPTIPHISEQVTEVFLGSQPCSPDVSSDEQMHAALEINIPNYASPIVRTDEIVRSLSSLSTARLSSAVVDSTMIYFGPVD